MLDMEDVLNSGDIFLADSVASHIELPWDQLQIFNEGTMKLRDSLYVFVCE